MDRDAFIQIRIKRPMSQLSVLSAVDERGSIPNYVPVVSLEYGLVPTSNLTQRLKGANNCTGSSGFNFKKSSRAHKLARQLGKSRHFSGISLDQQAMSNTLKGVASSRANISPRRIDLFAKRARERLHSEFSDRRSSGREHFTPSEIVLQRHYSDFPLPLRYSHHNQYDDAMQSARSDGSSSAKPFMHLFSSRMIRLKLMQNQKRQTMPFMANLNSVEVAALGNNRPPSPSLSQLLIRPRTAGTSLRYRQSLNQKAQEELCSITVIGQQVLKGMTGGRTASFQFMLKDNDDRAVIKKVDSNQENSADTLASTDKSSLTSTAVASESADKSGRSSVNGDSNVKGLSSCLLFRNNSFSKALSITSESMVISNRPNSVLSNGKSLRRSRPKTATIISNEYGQSPKEDTLEQEETPKEELSNENTEINVEKKKSQLPENRQIVTLRRTKSVPGRHIFAKDVNSENTTDGASISNVLTSKLKDVTGIGDNPSQNDTHVSAAKDKKGLTERIERSRIGSASPALSFTRSYSPAKFASSVFQPPSDRISEKLVRVSHTVPKSGTISNSPKNLKRENSICEVTMAKVDSSDRLSSRQHKLSIAEEIKRQNDLLEQRNIEQALTQDILAKPNLKKARQEKEKGVYRTSSFIGDRGNVCGSPGYRFMQQQMCTSLLKSQSMTNRDSRRLGPSTNSDRRYPKEMTFSEEREIKLASIRPLSECLAQESSKELCITGGSISSPCEEKSVSDVKSAGSRTTESSYKQPEATVNDAKTDKDKNNALDNQPLNMRLSILETRKLAHFQIDGCSPYASIPAPVASETHSQNPKASREKTNQNPSPKKSDLNLNQDGAATPSGTVKSDETSSESLDNQQESSIASSSSTATASFPGPDQLYGSDGMSRTAHSDDLGVSDISGYERDRQRLRDLEIGNKRPPSRSKRGSYALVEKGFDREEGQVLNNSLPAKPPTFRSNGIRSSLVRGEQLLNQRNTASNSGQETDELIAMGTLWSPANNNNTNNATGGGSSGPTTRSSSTTTASNKSYQNTGTSNGRKPISVNVNSMGRLNHSSNFSSTANGTLGKMSSNNKEVEPKYPDPLSGAPASFQQRLMELASLEAETIRWERTKKVKKKPKQDRDS